MSHQLILWSDLLVSVFCRIYFLWILILFFFNQLKKNLKKNITKCTWYTWLTLIFWSPCWLWFIETRYDRILVVGCDGDPSLPLLWENSLIFPSNSISITFILFCIAQDHKLLIFLVRHPCPRTSHRIINNSHIKKKKKNSFTGEKGKKPQPKETFIYVYFTLIQITSHYYVAVVYKVPKSHTWVKVKILDWKITQVKVSHL